MSATGPTELSDEPIDSIVHCMSEAAPHARSACRSSVEEEQQRVAAELEHVAAVPLGDGDQLGEDRRDGGDELLGPGRPCDASRSASAVKPEMSTETSVPSTVRRRSRDSSLQAWRMRGT